MADERAVVRDVRQVIFGGDRRASVAFKALMQSLVCYGECLEETSGTWADRGTAFEYDVAEHVVSLVRAVQAARAGGCDVGAACVEAK